MASRDRTDVSVARDTPVKTGTPDAPHRRHEGRRFVTTDAAGYIKQYEETATKATVYPVVPGAGGPDATKPCTGCPLRSRCQSPCSLLGDLIGSEHVAEARVTNSEALVAGRGYDPAWMVDHPALIEAEMEAWPEIVAHFGPKLHAAIAKISSKYQRETLTALAAGVTSRQIAEARGTSRQMVWKSVQAGIRALATQFPDGHTVRRLAEMGEFTADLDRERKVKRPKYVELTLNTQHTDGDAGTAKPRPVRIPIPQETSDMPRHSKAVVTTAPAGHDVTTATTETLDADVALPAIFNAPFTEGDKPLTAIEVITPALAARFLRERAPNRPLADTTIAKYVADIRAGEFRLIPAGLAFTADGQMLDGQHRCAAIVKAGMAVEMTVTVGLTIADLLAIDAGRPRSIADLLKFSGHDNCPRNAVSWLRTVAMLTTKKHVAVSAATIRAERQRLAPAVDWLLANGPKSRPLNRAPVLGAFTYVFAVAPSVVQSFLGPYLSGVGLVEGSPVLALRRLTTETLAALRLGDRRIAHRALRCLMAHAEGETLTRLTDSTEGLEYFQKLHAAHAKTAPSREAA